MVLQQINALISEEDKENFNHQGVVHPVDSLQAGGR